VSNSSLITLRGENLIVGVDTVLVALSSPIFRFASEMKALQNQVAIYESLLNQIMPQLDAESQNQFYKAQNVKRVRIRLCFDALPLWNTTKGIFRKLPPNHGRGDLQEPRPQVVRWGSKGKI